MKGNIATEIKNNIENLEMSNQLLPNNSSLVNEKENRLVKEEMQDNDEMPVVNENNQESDSLNNLKDMKHLKELAEVMKIINASPNIKLSEELKIEEEILKEEEPKNLQVKDSENFSNIQKTTSNEIINSNQSSELLINSVKPHEFQNLPPGLASLYNLFSNPLMGINSNPDLQMGQLLGFNEQTNNNTDVNKQSAKKEIKENKNNFASLPNFPNSNNLLNLNNSAMNLNDSMQMIQQFILQSNPILNSLNFGANQFNPQMLMGNLPLYDMMFNPNFMQPQYGANLLETNITSNDKPGNSK
jgi:hypothetical protein